MLLASRLELQFMWLELLSMRVELQSMRVELLGGQFVSCSLWAADHGGMTVQAWLGKARQFMP